MMLVSNQIIAQCDVPINLVSNTFVNGDGLNQADLSWDIASGALEYSVAYRVSGSGDPFSVKAASSNSVSLIGLDASTNYEWKVRSVCSSDWSVISAYSVIDNFTTGAGGSCTIPTNLGSVSSGSGSEINVTTLSWDAVAAADLYNVAYRVQGETSFTVKSPSTNSITLSGLPASTNFEWKVRTVCSPDWSIVSNYSALETFTTGTGVECTAPTGVNIASSDATSFTIAWNPVSGAEQYYIQFRIPAEQTWAEADYRFTYRTSDKTITGLTVGKSYEARMLAVCATDESGKWVSNSPYSTIVSFNTVSCTTPANLSSTPDATSATVFWDEVASAIQYQIKYRVSGTVTYNNEVSVNAPANSAQLTNLSPNTQYDWIIRARCSNDNTINSPYSAVQTFTTVDGTECVTPTGLNSVPNTSDALIQWSDVPTAIDYQVKWREQGTSTFLFSAIITDPTTSYTIENLNSSTTYEWLIRARCSVDGSNNSPYSTIQTFTTLAGPSCDTPTNLSSSPSENSAFLSWNPVVLADQYRLKYRVQGTLVFSNTVIISSPDNSVVISGLNSSTSYEWLIRSECPGENSAYSSIQTFTTTTPVTIVGTTGKISTNSRSYELTNKGQTNRAESASNLNKPLVEPNSMEFILKIYPNPASEFINIESSESATARIFNSVGKLVKVIDLEANQKLDMDVTTFNKGVYFIRTYVEGKIVSKKFIVR